MLKVLLAVALPYLIVPPIGGVLWVWISKTLHAWHSSIPVMTHAVGMELTFKLLIAAGVLFLLGLSFISLARSAR